VQYIIFNVSFFSKHSVEDRNKLIEEIKTRRKRVCVPDPLLNSAMNTVIKNYKLFFCKSPSNTCVSYYISIINFSCYILFSKFAANKVVQKFMWLIAHARKLGQSLIPEAEFRPFVLQFLNTNLTEFDCSMFNYLYKKPQFEDDYYFNYFMQDTFPKITKISSRNREFYKNRGIEVPVLSLKASFPNLRYFSLRNFTCSDETLRLIEENLPRIELVLFY